MDTPAAPVAKSESIESAGYPQCLGAMPPRASKHYVGGKGTPTLPYEIGHRDDQGRTTARAEGTAAG